MRQLPTQSEPQLPLRRTDPLEESTFGAFEAQCPILKKPVKCPFLLRFLLLLLCFVLSCLPLCGPMDCSPPESSVHGILQARILEWVLIFSSKGSS